MTDSPPLLLEDQESPSRSRKRSLVLSGFKQPPMLTNAQTPMEEEVRKFYAPTLDHEHRYTKIWPKVKVTIARFLTNTTSHGLPRVPRARNRCGSLFWLVVFGLALLIFLVTVLALYRRYIDQVPATAVTSYQLSNFKFKTRFPSSLPGLGQTLNMRDWREIDSH